jgi:hypothetical protein
MLGIGTLAKSLAYDGWIRAWPGEGVRFLRALAPDFHEYRRIGLMLVASREPRYLYVVNPKVASTTIRNRLRELNGYPPLADPRDIWKDRGSGFVMPREMSPQEVCAVCTGPGVFRFSFVRNPFDRIVSAYDQYQRMLDDGIFQKKALYRRRSDPRRDPKLSSRVSFPDFVRSVCDEGSVTQDYHWRRQTDILKTGLIDYDFIGKSESFVTDMRLVLERLGAPEAVLARVGQVSNASARRRGAAEIFDRQTADLVREKFLPDFETFGYGLDLPRESRSAAG